MTTDDQRDDQRDDEDEDDGLGYTPDEDDDENGPVARATRLNDRQRLAVALVLAGRTDADVAAAVGAHRVTVTRWRLGHPAFRSALSAGRQSAHRAAEQARRTLYQKALDRLARELDEDGPQAVRVAMALVATPPDDPGPVESVDDVVTAVASAWMRKFQNPMRWQPISGASCYSIATNLAGHVEEWEPDDDDPDAPDAGPGTSPAAT
jgi:hypothetical protein